MLLTLLSVNGTLRTLLLLVLLYLVLRMVVRSRQGGGPKGGSQWTNEPPRPPGDVRIERPGDPRNRSGQGPVEDADYEEIK